MNHLRTLRGGPAKVKGDFNCSANRLVTLTGAPSEIGGKVIIIDEGWDDSCKLSDEQIEAYLNFLKHPMPEHIDETGHYVE